MSTPLYVLATSENFDEAAYLEANPDIADAHRKGLVRNLRQHFEKHGRREGRRQRVPAAIADARAEKIARIEPLLNLDMPHVRRGEKYDFLTEALRAETKVVDTGNISANDYDGFALDLGESLPFKDGVFDAVISIAVLEHVRDPFRCAAEIVRGSSPAGSSSAACPSSSRCTAFRITTTT